MTGINQALLFDFSRYSHWYMLILIGLVWLFLLLDRKKAGNGLSNALIGFFTALLIERIWYIANLTLIAIFGLAQYDLSYRILALELRNVAHIVNGVAITYFFWVLFRQMYKTAKTKTKLENVTRSNEPDDRQVV